MGWRIDVRFPEGEEMFLFCKTSRSDVGRILLSVQWLLGAFSPRVKRLELEFYSPLISFSAEIMS
jgi:hypothetical protein